MADVKTNLSAVVVIPPPDLWEPIQAIRRKYDKKIDRWMPHINLLYPFLPRDAFDEAVGRIAGVLKDFPPIPVTLGNLRHFEHGMERYTMWLELQPSAPLVEMQTALQEAFPDCREVANFENGFVPHLSVGQARGRRFLESQMAEVRASWKPLPFTVGEVALIARAEGTPFEADRTVPLGS